MSAPVSATIREHRPATITADLIADDLGKEREAVDVALLRLEASGLARLSTFPPREAVDPGRFPLASPLVVAQIAAGEPYVSTRFHQSAGFTKPSNRLFVSLLDGTRDHAALRRDLPLAAAEAGITEGVAPLLADLDGALAVATSLGLLMPPVTDD